MAEGESEIIHTEDSQNENINPGEPRVDRQQLRERINRLESWLNQIDEVKRSLKPGEQILDTRGNYVVASLSGNFVGPILHDRSIEEERQRLQQLKMTLQGQ